VDDRKDIWSMKTCALIFKGSAPEKEKEEKLMRTV